MLGFKNKTKLYRRIIKIGNIQRRLNSPLFNASFLIDNENHYHFKSAVYLRELKNTAKIKFSIYKQKI